MGFSTGPPGFLSHGYIHQHVSMVLFGLSYRKISMDIVPWWDPVAMVAYIHRCIDVHSGNDRIIVAPILVWNVLCIQDACFGVQFRSVVIGSI